MKSSREKFARIVSAETPLSIHRAMLLLERAFVAGWMARGRNFYSLADRPFKQKRLDRMEALTGKWAWRETR